MSPSTGFVVVLSPDCIAASGNGYEGAAVLVESVGAMGAKAKLEVVQNELVVANNNTRTCSERRILC